ncbi:hypothetical protein [Sphingomonas edaphi]|nr:hypothetical protein [Sphingomonas edaphi]
MLKAGLKAPRRLEPEAKLAIAAILTTGRKLKDLRRMSIVEYESDLDLPGCNPEGLIWNKDQISWRFIAGTADVHDARRNKSKRAKKSRGRKGVATPPVYQFVYFDVEEIVQDCLKQFPTQFSPLGKARNGPAPLFVSRKEAHITKIEQLLDTRRPVECGRPRACSRTVPSLERFLTRAMTFQYGGDLVGAMRLTGREETLGRTANYYGETFVSNAATSAKRANGILRGDEKWVPSYAPDDQRIGNSMSPVWREVRDLAEACRKYLKKTARNPLKSHKAMTFQTVALLSFATGHRGMGEALPGSAAIDEITGFCKIHDKLRQRADHARMIWVADVAREQIAIYEDHLGVLGSLLKKQDHQRVLNMVASGRLPIFSIENGAMVRLRYRALWQDLSTELGLWRPMTPNAGRHWLRSVLSGRCSSDTLHAFFGHWLLGNEPWSFGSCLDPLLYRSEIDGVLTEMLKKIRWHARDATGAVA